MKRDNDSRSSKAKAFVICAGFGVLIVAVIGTVFWRDLQTRYHLYRIRNDIRYALTLIAQPEGTPERRAIRRYIEESLDFHGKLPRASAPDNAPGAIIPGNVPPSGRVDIVAGTLPAEDCCRFLSDWTGLTAIMDSDLWEAELAVPESLHAVDAELMGLLLAAHDCSVTVKTLPNERQVVRLRKATGSSGPSTDAAGLQRLTDLPPIDIAQGMITAKDLAAWMDAESEASISLSPALRNERFLLAAPIREADIFVIQELLSAGGCVLESSDENGLRIAAAPAAED